MCPVTLRKVLKEREHRLETYDKIRVEIADWLADSLPSGARGGAAALEPAEPESPTTWPEPTWGDTPWDFDPDLLGAVNSGHW